MRHWKGILTLLLLTALSTLSGCISFESDVFAAKTLPEASEPQTPVIVAQSVNPTMIKP